MLGLRNAQTLVGLITLFLAYFITISPAGSFRAWVAKKMGDSTAEDLGFLSLNPLVHIDFLGLAWLLFFSHPEYFSGFGWGRHVPINPHNIQGKWRWLKLICAFFSASCAHFVMATAAFTLAAVLFFENAKQEIFCSSSFSVIIVHLLFALLSLNIFLVLVQVVINAIVLIAMYVSDGTSQATSYLYYFVLFAPLIILLLFGAELQYFLIKGVTFIQRSISACLSTQ